MDVYDVIVIGGGPAGASCALYTSRARLKTIVLDKSSTASALAMTAKIANYPGVRGEVPGAQLIETIRAQAMDFGAKFVQTGVAGADLKADPKLVFTSEGTFAGKTVVISTGAMGRKERVPGEEEFIGRGVSYCATCDGAFFTNREVAVVGDGEFALEEALFLTRFAARVHLIASRPDLRASDDLVDLIVADENITIHYNTRFREVIGDDLVTGIKVAGPERSQRVIPVEGVFILLSGMAPTTDFLGGVLPLTMDGCLSVDSEKSTVIPGVYAVGDVTCNHVKQAVVAAADGVIAALAIDKYINKRGKIKVDYK